MKLKAVKRNKEMWLVPDFACTKTPSCKNQCVHCHVLYEDAELKSFPCAFRMDEGDEIELKNVEMGRQFKMNGKWFKMNKGADIDGLDSSFKRSAYILKENYNNKMEKVLSWRPIGKKHMLTSPINKIFREANFFTSNGNSFTMDGSNLEFLIGVKYGTSDINLRLQLESLISAIKEYERVEIIED